jgi:hypothetical protein
MLQCLLNFNKQTKQTLSYRNIKKKNKFAKMCSSVYWRTHTTSERKVFNIAMLPLLKKIGCAIWHLVFVYVNLHYRHWAKS